MSDSEKIPCRTPASLLGVMIRFCEAGEVKDVWVDLGQVHAVSWCGRSLPPKQAHQGEGKKMPTHHRPPDKTCADVHDLGGPPGSPGMCWWDGSDWVCGEA